VVITHVRLLDAIGGETSCFSSGEATNVEIHYAARQHLPNAILVVSVHSAQGNALHLDLDTPAYGVTWA
jgi:hypothetical protein